MFRVEKRQGKRNPRRNRPRRRGLRPGEVRRVDSFGRTYGGTIRPAAKNAMIPFSPKPRLPLKDADYSTCQMVNNITIGSGFTNGSGTAPITITATDTSDVAFAMAPSFQDLGQGSTMAALFDQYRIDRVEFHILPEFDATGIPTGAPNNTLPVMAIVLDHDDSTVLSGYAAALEYDNVQIIPSGQGAIITLEPAVTPATFAVSAFSGYAVEKAGWIDMNSTSVPHYGVKGIITALQGTATLNVQWDILVKYYVSMRNTR